MARSRFIAGSSGAARAGPGQVTPSPHPWWTAPGHSRRLPCAPVGGEARAERANRRNREPPERLFVQSDRRLKGCLRGRLSCHSASGRPVAPLDRGGWPVQGEEREAARRQQCGTGALRLLESGTIRSWCRCRRANGDVRFGWRARISMAPAPHVDGDPSWGLARSRRPGPLPGRHTKACLRYPAFMTAE